MIFKDLISVIFKTHENASHFRVKICNIRPVGQAVKTPASHAGDGSSILPRVIKRLCLDHIGQILYKLYANMACYFFKHNMDH